MNILFLDWETFADRDIIHAFEHFNHKVLTYTDKPANYTHDISYEAALSNYVTSHSIDAIFSSNYYPIISNICTLCNIPYISWVYDSPQILLYHKTILNSFNYVFIFDKTQYEELSSLGVSTVYYLPLAAEVSRIDKLHITPDDISKYSCDISFVGALYNEEHNLYDRMCENLDHYTIGYLDALIKAQENVYGYFFLDELLCNNSILSSMQKAMPYKVPADSFATTEYVYGNYFLGRKLAERQRYTIIDRLSTMYDFYLYTTGDTNTFSYVKNKGTLSYYDEMSKAFRLSKINLNISLRTIKSGIPLRCFDIMGAGGFLLTNYQADLCDLFIPDEDFVYYEDNQDMITKLDYYLSHEDERIAIANNGYEKVKSIHKYEDRIQIILDALEKRAL